MANADDIIRVRLVLDESTVSAVENRVRNIVNRLNSQQFNIQVNQTSINNAIARLRELENTANRIQNQNININANLTTAQQSYRLETERLRVSQQLAVQRELTAQSENRAIAALSAQNRTLNITRTNTENINQNVEHTYNNLRNANNAGNDFANHLARGLQYLLQYRILNSILSSVTDAVAEIKDLDKELIAYRKATNATEDEMKSLTKTAFQTAKAMGQVPSAYGKAISTFGKAGYRDTAKELSELSLLTQSVGDVDADISNQFLLATDKAYKYQGSIESLTKVLDGANSIENNYATSIQKVADGMGLIAPLAAQQEVAVNELMAGLGTITAVTQRSGSEAARSLRALILNIRGVKGAILDETTGEMLDDASIKKTEEVLNKYGFKIREFKNGAEDLREPMKVVEEIANSLKSGALSEVGLQEITDTIGGKLRSSQLTALISNFDMYKQMLKTYSEADGSARREMEISLDSYEKKLQSVKASWAEYIASLADSRTVKNAIDALGVAIDMLNTPIGKVLSQIILINTALTVSSRLWQMIRSRSIVADILSLGVAEGNLKDAIGLVNGHLREQAVHFLSSPTGQFAAGLTLVIGVIEGVKFAIKQHNDAIQTYVNSQKEIISTADENIQKYEEEKSSLESLQKKLSEARGDKTKLSEVTIELNKAIGNTPDLLNDEANAYDIANAKIRARIKELGDLTTAEKNRKVNAQREIFKSNETSVKFGTDDMTAVGLSIDIKEASEQLKISKEQKQKYLDIGAKEDSIAIKEADKKIARYKSILQSKATEAQAVFGDWINQQFTDATTQGYFNKYIEDLIFSGEDDLGNIDEKLLDFSTKITEFNKLKDNLISAHESGDGYKKEYEALENFINNLSSNIPEGTTVIEEMKIGFDALISSLTTTSENGSNAVDSFLTKLKSLNEELDKIQSAYQTVASAIEEYNENGYLSVDTYQKLLELAPEYMSMLMDENGNLTLTKESWRLLTEAKIRDMYQTQANQYIESIKAAADSGNLEQLDKLTQGYKNLAEAKVIDYKATLATLNLTDEQRAGAEAYLSGLEKAMNQTIAGLGKGGMGGGSKTAKKQEDLAKQVREKEKQIEEAWEKERLEQLKDDLEKRKNEIEKYKNYIETLDFGLDILDSSDYSGQIDLLEQKFDNLVTYGQQLRQEFERVSQLTPETADEAQAIASRVQEIGSEMRNNVKTLRETQTELLKAPILFLTNASSKYINDISSGVERIRWQLEEMTKPYNKDNDFLNRLLPFDMLFPDLNEYDAALSEKAKHDKALIAEEQKTQDTINKIVTDALEKQSEENAKARAEERTKLQEELDEISKEYKSALDTASKNTSETQKKISNEFNNISNSAGTMQQNVDTHFGNMETSVTTHVDNTIKKIDELKDKITKFNPLSYDPNQELMSKLPSNNNAGGIGGAVAPAMTRQSSSYGNRIHPIYGTKKFHDGIDLAAPGGSPVLAYSQGTVTYAGWNGGYGNYVAIDHGNGYTTFYGHMSKINVSKGQTVSKGTRIGSVGTTGNSTGNHLHFGAKYNGSSVNPNKLFPAFSKGTNFHSGGELVLGEDGKELVIYPNGTAEIVGENGTEMRDLPRGTKVIPNEETEKILKDKKKDDGTYDIDFSQYSAFNVKNLPDTIKTIDKDNQWIRGQIELRYDERANAINYDFKTGKINKNQLSEAQNGLIDYLINGDEKNSGLKKMAEDALDDATNLLKAYNDAVTLDPTLANNETREALVQMQNDAWDYYESIMQMEQESYDFKVQKQEDYAEARKLWWDRDLEALDYEEYVRQRIISDLEKEIDLTDDYTKKLILRNKLTKEYNDTIAYSDANEKAKRNILIEQTNELLDYIKDNNLGLDISGWFDKDGNLTDKYAFDTQNLVDTEFYPFINGYVQAMANTYASINDTNEKRANAIAENLNLDKQRIEDLKTSLQKVMDDEKDYMNDKITYYNSLNSLLAKYYSVTNSITEAHHNINKELKAAQTSYKYLDAQTRLLLFNENDYVALTKELNDIQSKANRLKSQYEYDLLHAQKEDIAEITNNYERQYDLLMKQYEISKAKLEVEKKRIQLDNVLNERNVRMFVNGQWQWVANTQDVIDAQNELEDAKYNESKAGTELTQTQSLNNLSASAD